jgi:hypothetical protein
MAGSKEDTETGAFFQEHARAGSATPLLVVNDGAASTAPTFWALFLLPSSCTQNDQGLTNGQHRR